MIDGLNKLVDSSSQEVGWLPASIPPNCRLVLSTTQGRAAVALARRGFRVVEVSGLTPEEQRQIVSTYLANFGKRLDPSLMDQVLDARQTAAPGYLLSLLEGLRLFGDYEALKAQVQWYLQAPDLVSLMNLILGQLEADYEAARPHLVKDALSLLWATRRGIFEKDLLSLLGSAFTPLPVNVWAPLRVALGNHLRKHFGLLIITDAAFREAVRRRYLTTEEDVTTVHRHLATFHLSKDPDDADWREALWHLRGGRRWPELIRLLASLTVLGRVWKQSKDEVLGYWKEIEGETEFRLEDTYQEVLNDPLNNASSLEELLPLIDLLLQSGHSEAVKALIKKLPFVAGKPIDSVSLEGLDQVRSPLMRGEILYEGGHFEAALKEFGEEERLCRETNSDEVLSLALLKKGQTLERLGELEPAEAAYRESEQISRLGGYKRNLLLVLDAQTNFLLRLGRQQEGQALRAELEYLRGDASTDA